jgi:hypothetical protein
MLGTALLLGVPAAVTGNGSTFIWVDVGVCLVLAAVLFLVGTGDAAPQYGHPHRGRPREVNPHRWRDTALVLAAVITIFSPVVTFFVELGGAAIGPVAGEQRECRTVPPPDDPPS